MVDQVVFNLDAKPDPKQVAWLLQHDQIKAFDGPSGVTPAVVQKSMDSLDTAIVICRLNETAAGYILVRWVNPICVKLSFGFFEPARGSIAKRFIRQFLDPLFKAGIIKVVGEVASPNRACMRLVASMGAKREGVNRGSTIYQGEVVDQVYFGLTVKDWMKEREN